MEILDTEILNDLQSRHYGKYRGYVVAVDDPKNLGRIRAKVPSILGDAPSHWALPCLPFGGAYGFGFYSIPPIGSYVWIEFEEGDLSHPIWTGAFWSLSEDLPEAAIGNTSITMMKTPGGHELILEDKIDERCININHSNGANISITEDGSLALTDTNGATLTLNASDKELLVKDSYGNTLRMSSGGTSVEDNHGNTIKMAAAGIEVKGQKVIVAGQQVLLGGQGGEPLIKGQSFLNMYMTHTHPAMGGVTGPPIPQGEISTLSMKVKTS